MRPMLSFSAIEAYATARGKCTNQQNLFFFFCRGITQVFSHVSQALHHRGKSEFSQNVDMFERSDVTCGLARRVYIARLVVLAGVVGTWLILRKSRVSGLWVMQDVRWLYRSALEGNLTARWMDDEFRIIRLLVRYNDKLRTAPLMCVNICRKDVPSIAVMKACMKFLWPRRKQCAISICVAVTTFGTKESELDGSIPFECSPRSLNAT